MKYFVKNIQMIPALKIFFVPIDFRFFGIFQKMIMDTSKNVLKNHRVFALFVLTFFGLVSYSQKKQVCFSFDDLPLVTYGIKDTSYQKKIFSKLILSLKCNKIPAIGFVNEGKLYDNKGLNAFQVGLLNKWIGNGLEIGNHTFSHPNYYTSSFKEYSQDILKGEKITREILERNGIVIKYFRHPYLQTGKTKIKYDSLNNFLSDHGYIIAPVTIENEDFYFALAYKRAQVRKDTNLIKKIGCDYIAYMQKKLRYFETMANKLFGRDINQILILHSNALNSDYTDSLASIFRRNNYDFVSMDKALEDDVYKSKITVFGNWGISWIDRWALSEGRRGDFFKDNPPVPDYIKKMSE